MTGQDDDQEPLYREAVAQYGAALARLAKGYEPDPHRCEDLLQEIHLALWTSLRAYERRCSLRTWVYRVAHNTAISRVTRQRRRTVALVSLDDLAEEPSIPVNDTRDRSIALRRLYELIGRLAPVDRQIMLLYLEDVDAASISEIVGLSATNVATKIHRIKKLLSERFRTGE